MTEAAPIGTPNALDELVPVPTAPGARELLSRMYACRRAARLYPIDHPSVSECVRLFLGAIEDMQRKEGDISLALSDGEVMLGNRLLVDESIHFDQLIRDLTGDGIGSIVLRSGIGASELMSAVRVLSAESYEIERAGGVEAMARAAGLSHIEIGTVRVFDRNYPGGEAEAMARASYGGAMALVRDINEAIRANEPISAESVAAPVRSLIDNVLTNPEAMLQLSGLRSYDEYTFYHSTNVAILSLAVGARISRAERFLSSLGTGALLHDIGKLSVEADVLNKPGPLSAEEWAHVREHSLRGAQLAASMPGIDRSALVTILEHHMRYDGAGYPRREPHRNQHLASRIVAVADAYDAMTSNRSYSAARSQDDAIGLLADSAGSSFDAAIVRLFVQTVGIFPPRSVVRLSNGEIAIVLEPRGGTPARPLVRIVADREGAIIDPRDVDLSCEADDLSVCSCVDPHLIRVDVEDFL